MRPPRLARWLVSLWYRGDRREVLLGDLAEGLAARRARWGSAARARRWYWRQAVGAVLAAWARSARGRSWRGPPSSASLGRRIVMGEGGESVMSSLWMDARQAVRSFGRRPGFTALVVSTLALGIGANAAIFSVVDGVLLRPLPFQDPDRLTFVWGRMTETSVDRAPFSGPDLLDFRERAASFDGLAGVFATPSTLTDGDGAESIQVAWVTTNFLDVLGVDPVLGRRFVESDRLEMDPSIWNDPVRVPPPAPAIISHGLWQRRFAGAADVVGRAVRVNGQRIDIIGVAPPGFKLYLPANASMPTDVDLWTPVPVSLAAGSRDAQWLTLVARLADGVAVERARAEMRAVAARLREEHQFHANVGMEVDVVPMHGDVVEHVRPVLLALLGAVGFVLLIACANVANLLLIRAQSREREIAVRLALGGGRGRIVRQMLVESAILALAGGALGLLLALGGIELLLALRPPDLPRADVVALDGRVFGFGLAVSAVAALLFGMAPATRASNPDLTHALTARGGTSGRQAGRLRDLLVVAEVGLSLILLIGGGLMLRSFSSLRQVEPGFRAEDVLVASVTPPVFQYRTPRDRVLFLRSISERLASLPGVESVGGVTPLPLTGGSQLWFGPYALTEDPAEWSRNEVDYRVAMPGFFEAVGTRVLRGRELTPADNEPDARPVVVVDRTMAARAWPDRDAVGQRVLVMKPGVDGSAFERYWAAVVGVVEHVRYDDLTRDGRETIYFPVREWNFVEMTFTARVRGEPAALAGAVREAIAAVDPGVAPNTLRPFADFVAEAMAPVRFALLLITVFAAVALTLACVGLYGVLSYAVRSRTREIGIRQALGAGAGQLRRAVLGQGGLLILAGIALGVVGALLLTRILSGLLFGVAPTDPVTYVVVSALLGLVAIGACWIPARRATRIDPLEALRAE